MKEFTEGIVKAVQRGVEKGIKGGPGSGSWEGPGDPRFEHEGSDKPPRENQTGRQRSGGEKWDVGNPNRTYKNGEIDRTKYKELSGKEKIQVLRYAISKYKENYVRKGDVEDYLDIWTPTGKPAKPPQEWDAANKKIGQYEGIRRALINKGESLKGSDLRKMYHAAIELQSKAGKMAERRTNIELEKL